MRRGWRTSWGITRWGVINVGQAFGILMHMRAPGAPFGGPRTLHDAIVTGLMRPWGGR